MFTWRHLPSREYVEELAGQIPEVKPHLPAINTFLDIVRLASDLTCAYDTHFARWGLSQGKFTVMMALRHAGGGISPSELAEQGGVTRGTITGLLDGLEKQGLVERQNDAGDRRMTVVKLTAKGHALMEEFLPDHFRRSCALTEGLSEAERGQLRTLLEKVRSGIGAVRDP